MAKTGIYVGLDIGTTSVKVVVAEYLEDQMNIIGVGNARSEGLNKGIIIDIDKAARSIQRAVRQAEEKSGIKIKSVNVGLPANLIEIEECQGMIAVHSESKEITDIDVQNVASAAIVRSTPPERQIIALVPQEFKVDGFEGIKDPRGMIGVRLDMRGLVFTGPRTIVHNIKKCVELAGLHLEELVITPIALGETILSDGEKEFGTVIIDMGGGQTTTAVMYESELKYAHVEQEGGEFVTKDISVVLNTSVANAEALKINYGTAYPPRASTTEDFPVDVIGQKEPVKVDEHYLSEIIEARVEQIFSKSRYILEAIDALTLPGGVVLTGGAASIPGVVDLAAEIFETNVKLYVPNHMGLRNPVFSNVISITEYAANLSDVYHIAKAAVVGAAPQVSSVAADAITSAPPAEQAIIQEPQTNIVQTTEHKETQISEAPGQIQPAKSSEDGGDSVGAKIKGFFSNIFD